MINKEKVGILGTGNVGTDLLLKVRKSKFLECDIFSGLRESERTELARELGINISVGGIDAIIENGAGIVFDATTASAHRDNSSLLKDRFVIDLTPSRVGVFCVPAINLGNCLDEMNLNMATCGGQAMAPIAVAYMKVHPEIEYLEVVSSMSSKSAGIGTRNNIDEYTQATADVIEELSGVKRAKAIIVLNPAEPPVIMQNTLYARIADPDIEALGITVGRAVEEIKKYTPGYKLVYGPIWEKQEDRVTTIIRCEGAGDYLPKFAGNLDIITNAGIHVAETYVKRNTHR